MFAAYGVMGGGELFEVVSRRKGEFDDFSKMLSSISEEPLHPANVTPFPSPHSQEVPVQCFTI